MKFSVTWLKDHLETEASLQEITDTLNAIGLEVEGVEDPSETLAGFKVAKVLTAAGRLRRAQCACRHEGCAGPARCGRSVERHGAKEKRDPRRRVERHDVFGARA